LAGGLRELGLQVEQHTNMVFVNVERPQELAAYLNQEGILVLPGARMRLVTHLDVDAAGIERALSAFRAFYAASAPAGRQARSR
jgi:threonine aldolase